MARDPDPTRRRGTAGRMPVVVLAATVGLVLVGGIARAGQPISVSLVECSAIFNEAAHATGPRSTEARRRQAARASASFREAALREARRERLDRPQAHVEAWDRRLRIKWHGRFARVSLLRENLDWIKYCRSLGRHRGVLPARRK